MSFSPSWRTFRRMQDSAFAAGALIYAAAVVYAWQVLPGGTAMKAQRTLMFPGVFFVLSLAAPLTIAPLGRFLRTHLWISFRTGFGQSVISVLTVVAVLASLAGFIYLQTAQAGHGGRYPAGVFSGYAAGVGLLLAQAILTRRIERDPALRLQIEPSLD